MILFFLVALCLLLLLGNRYKCIYYRRGSERWSVGISRVKSLNNISNKADKVLSHQFIKESSGMDFAADPFLLKKDGRYYLFVEAAINEFGRLDVYSSSDLERWEHEGIALSKDIHLSYPQVFWYNDKVYMIPETKSYREVGLYESIDFPLKWEKKRVLLKGKFVDTTILFYENSVYLFGYNSGVLECYVSNDLLSGEFKEHPFSPLGIGNKMRPGGTIFIKDDKIIIPVQSRTKGYGYALYSVVVKELTPDKIRYRKGGALLKPDSKSEYFKEGEHTLSILKEDDGYVVAIDGRSGIHKAYWRNNCSKAWDDFKNDVRTFFIILKNNYRRNA